MKITHIISLEFPISNFQVSDELGIAKKKKKKTNLIEFHLLD
jgi:hypothetical protein